MKLRFKYLIPFLSITLFSAFGHAKDKETIIIMPPTFDAGAYQDFVRSESISDSDKEAVPEKLQASLKQSIAATRKYKIKLIRKGKLASQINSEISNATVGQEIQYAVTYMQDNKARFLISPVITAINAKRFVISATETQKNYRDSGTITVRMTIVDTGVSKGSEEEKGKGAGEQRASKDVTVSYKTPYKRLNNTDDIHVNTQFWNSILKKATAQLASKLIEESNPLQITKGGKRRVEINRGSDNADFSKGDKFNVFDNDGNMIGVVQIIKIKSRITKAKVISSTIEIEEDFLLEKIEDEDDSDEAFF